MNIYVESYKKEKNENHRKPFIKHLKHTKRQFDKMKNNLIIYTHTNCVYMTSRTEI